MEKEETLVLIKPDGIQKGATELIKKLIIEHGLEVVVYKKTTLTKEWVSEFYREHEGEDFFYKTIEWLTSSPVVIMKVKGVNAIHIVKFQIIGRYPNGIRGFLSENEIKNVAHASESRTAADRELRLAQPLFNKSPDLT